MDTFTYETQDKYGTYETYEWDNTWIDQAEDNCTNRVFYIGDSISCATRTAATALCGQKILFDGFGTSKALDNPFLKDAIALFAAQLPRMDAILFNNGLHGWHLDDTAEYAPLFEQTISFLRSKFPDTPIMIVLTTRTREEMRIPRILARNTAAVQTAEKFNLPVIDLYTLSEQYEHLLKGDGVHFTPEGYDVIAKTILREITTHLPHLRYE